MFWLDKVVEDILQKYPDQKKFILRDEKTLSGRVHVGSLRGVVIHGLVTQALCEKGKNAEFIFEFNDADPMDAMPSYLDPKEYQKYMGLPLTNIPSPEPGFANFAEYYGAEFLNVIHKLGINPTITRASELYKQGIYNQWIDKALIGKDQIKKIYKEVSGSLKDDKWYPLQVVCEKCGKIGTTMVTGVNGDKVIYDCLENMVIWTKGCGHHGECTPYNGQGKLPWKVEWPVKWAGNNVTIEGSGKDHNAAGGSHDVAARISQEVLGMPVPYNIPYEFFLIGGKKMSSSKGRGSTSKDIADLLPGELLRFLMIKSEPNHPIDFNPEGSTIPVLYDQYDECANQYFLGPDSTFPDQARIFKFSQLTDKKIEKYFSPRFSQVAFLVQMPHLDPILEIEKIKGSKLTERELQEANTRIQYAKNWITSQAPEAFVFQVQEQTPQVELSVEQKNFLTSLATLMQNKALKGAELHAQIHELRKNSPLEPRLAFQAIYLAILGKDSGPQAGWFLDALDRDFVINRFLAFK